MGQLGPAALQVHLLQANDLSLLQPHPMTSSRSAGATRVYNCLKEHGHAFVMVPHMICWDEDRGICLEAVKPGGYCY